MPVSITVSIAVSAAISVSRDERETQTVVVFDNFIDGRHEFARDRKVFEHGRKPAKRGARLRRSAYENLVHHSLFGELSEHPGSAENPYARNDAADVLRILIEKADEANRRIRHHFLCH